MLSECDSCAFYANFRLAPLFPMSPLPTMLELVVRSTLVSFLPSALVNIATTYSLRLRCSRKKMEYFGESVSRMLLLGCYDDEYSKMPLLD